MTTVRLAWVCVLVAGCESRTAAPEPERAAPTVDEERRANVEAYERSYVPLQTALVAGHRGEWLAIAGGRIVPWLVESPAPVPTMEAADEWARRFAPDARQRFIFQIGEEGDVDWPIGGWELPHVLGTQFLALLERDDVRVRFDARHPSVLWRQGDRLTELTVPADELAMHVRPEVGAPGAQGRATETYCVSTSFAGFAMMSPASADGLEMWEIPGVAHVEGGTKSANCRRARARIRWPNTPLDFAVPVAIWPK